MGFFLLRRDGDVVTLIAPTVLGTRQEALAEVSRASAAGALDADEVFVIDLDTATPVLIVSPLSPPADTGVPALEDPAAGEPDATGGAQDDSATGNEALLVTRVEAAIAEAILADAEDSLLPEPANEALTAEETVEPETQPTALEPEEADHSKELEEAEEAVELEDEEPELSPEPVAQTWPWDPVPTLSESPALLVEVQPDEDGDRGEVTADDEDEVADEVEVLDVNGETDELPEEVSGLLADLEEIPPGVSVGDEEEEAPEPPSEIAAANPEGDDESAQARAVADVLVGQSGPESNDAAEPSAEVKEAKAYEAGASDITALTCDDCIYLNTCPKKGESDPTSCGSFQWKSV